MKYMLMMNAPRGTGDWGVMKWPAEDLKAHIAFMKRFTKALADAGELVAAEGLAPPDASQGRAGAGQRRTSGDGWPFRRGQGIPRRLLDCRCRRPRARLRDRRGRVGGTRRRRQAVEHADRSARSDERATCRGVTAPRLDAAAENLLRELAPQVLGATIRRFKDFGAAEDAVQEALVAASVQWPKEGVPDNPRGWLIHVAARRMTDYVRSDIARRDREELAVRPSVADPWSAVPRSWNDRAGRHARPVVHVLPLGADSLVGRRAHLTRCRAA